MTSDGADTPPEVQLTRLYPWRGATEAKVDAACTLIARRLLQRTMGVIGFLSARGTPPLAPLLVRLARNLARFQDRPTGVIPRWSDWMAGPPDAERVGGDGHGPLLTVLKDYGTPTLVTPPPATDASTAALSLQLTLRRVADRFPQLFVDFQDYPASSPGVAPAVLALADGVAVVGARGRSTLDRLHKVAALIPPEKNLGVIVMG